MAGLGGRGPGAGGAAPAVPGQAIAPGFAVVAVPPGRHEVALRFGPSGPRAGGAALSLAALLGAAGWLARRGGRPGAPAGLGRPGPRGRRGALAGALLLAAGVGVAGVRLALPLLPPAPGAGDALLVADLAGAVAGGAPGARVAAPDGGALGPGAFADVRPLALLAADRPLRDAGPDARRWLYLHPPAGATAEVAVPPGGAWLQAGLALDPAAWGAPLGDGVRFVAEVAPLAGPGAGEAAVVLDATLNPRARGEQRRWADAVADLTPWAGRRVALTLRTEGRGDPAYDWAGWGAPAVVRADPLTAARLRHSARLIAALALDE